MKNNNKINLDQYYTPDHIAEYCFNKTIEIIGKENITLIVESSAGTGVFIKHIKESKIGWWLAFDIAPAADEITEIDFLKLKSIYKKGTLIGFNPPFGEKNHLIKKFYNKAIEMGGDYISFILPITQLDNNQSLYKFDLLHSEDLGIIQFSHLKEVHCCLNIYARPKNGILNKKKDYTLKDIDIYRFDRGAKNIQINQMQDYDFALCTWGNGSCGKTPEFIGQYAQEQYIIINNLELKDKILEICNNTNWKEEVAPKNTSSKKIQTWRIYKYLKEQIPELI